MKAILEYKSDRLPVSIDYVRDYFALGESDEEIKAMLKVAIEHIELQNGLSLQKKVWKIIHNNSYVQLGLGPVIKVLSITNASGVPVEPISIKRAHDNLIVQLKETNEYTHIRYEAGYDDQTLPECLKHTLLEKFWDVYAESVNHTLNTALGDACFDGMNDVMEALDDVCSF